MDDAHALTLRLEEPLYEALRLAAFQLRESKSDFIRESIRARLAELEAGTDAA